MPKFTKFDKSTNWVDGVGNGYSFQAKLYDVGSPFGINEGRVSKLSMWPEGTNWNQSFVHYDRGWDVEPGEDVKDSFDEVMDFLESSPLRFEDWKGW